MENGSLYTTVETLTRIVLPLYFLVALIVYRWLIPHLSPISKRLASFMLAAQVLLIVVALEIRPSSDLERWQWHLDMEWNIPSILATAQLGLVGGVTLLTAAVAKSRPAWHRMYWLLLGLLLLFLALDEYFVLREGLLHSRSFYTVIGVAIAAMTGLIATRSPQKSRKWMLVLMAGFAICGSVGIFVDELPSPCDRLGFLRFEGCVPLFVWEEALEFLGFWLVLLAMLGTLSEFLPAPRARHWRLLYAMPVLWIALLFLHSLIPRLELQLVAQPSAVQFELGVSLDGYALNYGEDSVVLRIYASARQRDYIGFGNRLGYSLHLVDQASGDSLASHTEYANLHDHVWLLGVDHQHIFRDQLELEIPSQTPANRAFWVVLSLWRNKDESREFPLQDIVYSDQQLLSDRQVVLDELVVPAVSAASASVPLAVFDSGFTLGAVELPQRARPGETLTIPFAWRSDVDGHEDHAQFLHVGHLSPPGEGESVEGGASSVASGAWLIYDQQPLGPRLPTRLWYSGLADSEIWQVPLPADLAPGRYTIFTGLYRTRDLERVPASDADGTPFVDARVPLGILIVE